MSTRAMPLHIVAGKLRDATVDFYPYVNNMINKKPSCRCDSRR